VPTLKPFRGLRYAPSQGPDLSAVVCPPYDIIPDALADELLARSPANAVRLELPRPEPGGDDDTRYRAAARALAEWRTDGILVKERQPSLYVHEMRWPAGGLRMAGRARGVLTRLRLEAFGPDGGVRPHERTMSGPKEDRFRLLKATGVNLSPVVLLADGGPHTSEVLDRFTARDPDLVATTDDGVAHQVWIVPVERDEDGQATGEAAELLASLGAQPLTIADGHHRYETALRYRAERDTRRACESDPAWDYVLALVYDLAEAPPVLPTHRVLLAGPTGDALIAAIGDLVEVEPVDGPETLLARMTETEPVPTGDATGTGRIGLVSGDRAAILRVRSAAIDALGDPAVSAASRGLDVARLATMLERLGVDREALAAGGRVSYVKDPAEAVGMVTGGAAAATFLLDGPPVSAVTRVAAAGEVMPQKSTYFDPKAPTGLVFGPLEW
jgi:uncharacterized protein (DUF1015 family)